MYAIRSYYASKGRELQQAAAEEDLSVTIKTLDVTKPETFEPFISEISEEAGSIDILVNNAGMVSPVV